MVCEKCEKKGKLGKVNYHFVNFALSKRPSRMANIRLLLLLGKVNSLDHFVNFNWDYGDYVYGRKYCVRKGWVLVIIQLAR